MSPKLSRILWPGLIFVFIGANVTVVLITVVAANYSSGAAAEPDYYRKAVNWDQTSAERVASDNLGWTAELAGSTRGAVLTLKSHDGRPLDGAAIEIEHFAVLDSGHRATTTCTAQGEGRYAIPGPLPSGTTEFRIRATRGDDLFVSIQRTSIAPEANP